MPRRTVGFKGFGLTVDIPDSVGRKIRQVGRKKISRASMGGLVLSDSIPVLHVEKHDPQASVDYFTANNPDTQGDVATDPVDLRSRIDSFDWYHTIDLGGGHVTKGVFDHRPLVPHYGIPADLRGKRVIDVATFDGFWAFEFERRGGEVTAIDLPQLSLVDFPPPVRDLLVEQGRDQEMGKGFALAAEALGSKARRIWTSIYEMDPDALGTFDLVHIADVLLHLERPLDALRALRSITSDDGEALIVDTYDPTLADPQGRHLTQYRGGWWTITWWVPSLDTLAQMVLDAGFSEVTVHKTYKLAKTNEPFGYWRAVLKAKP